MALACLSRAHHSIDTVVMEQADQATFDIRDALGGSRQMLPGFESGATQGIVGLLTIPAHSPEAVTQECAVPILLP